MIVQEAACDMRNGSAPCRRSPPTRRTDVRGIIRLLETRLREAGISTARVEAEWLLAGSLGVTRTELYLLETPVAGLVLESVWELLERRVRGEPLQYLLGSTEFCGHRLVVTPAVFIPRPETEIVAAQAIQALRGMVRQGIRAPRVLELGTGSGNLAITLANAVPACVVVAVELSWEALRVARTNVSAQGIEKQVHLLQADWTQGVRGPVDLIVSNPPYIVREHADRLVRRRLGDPRLSLDGGPDGLSLYRRLVVETPRLLAHGGMLVVECAETQPEPLRQLIMGCSWAKRVHIFEDLAGRPRGLCVHAKNNF